MNLYDIYAALKSATDSGDVRLFEEARGGNWKRIAESEAHRSLVDELRVNGERIKKEPITSILFSKYKMFETTGDRSEFEYGYYFPRRARLCYLCALTLLDGGEDNISALEDCIWAICDEYSWCVTAHFDRQSLNVIDQMNAEAFLKDGYTGRFTREHRRRVDLFAAETGFALAETLSLLGDKLHPLVVDRAEKELRQRILEPYMELNEFFGWASGTANWTSVCSGAVGAAAIYLIKDDAVLARVLRNVLDSMDRYFLGFSAEGVCTEGVGYWTYGFSFFTCFAELLCQRTGGRIELMTGERRESIATFIQRARITGDIFPSFSDCGVGMRFNLGLYEHLHKKFPSVAMPPVKYATHLDGDRCYRFCNFMRAIVWYTGLVPESPEPEGDTIFNDAQWAISRADGGTAMAAKGGYNAEPHNQNDVGNFLLLSNGEMLFPDLGAGEYSRQYFGPDRYSFFNCGSQGHSVPIINGETQRTGKDYAALDIEMETVRNGARVRMDIAGAYAVDGLNYIRREMEFDKTKKIFSLTDAFGTDAPTAITERIIAASVKCPDVSAGVVEVFGINTRAAVAFDADKYECKINPAPDDVKFALKEYGIYTIDWTPKELDKNLKFKIQIQL